MDSKRLGPLPRTRRAALGRGCGRKGRRCRHLNWRWSHRSPPRTKGGALGAGASHRATAAEPTAAEPAVAAAASAPRRAHIRPVARMDASMARDRKLRGC